MRPPSLLSLDMDLIRNDQENDLLETTYRSDGISIGRDYLRLNGKTWTRGELSPERLDIQEVLGRGAFSIVRKAVWSKNREFVAIKTYSIVESSKHRCEMLLKELKVFSQVDSPHLVKLFGAYLQVDTVTMVLEYMDAGSLHDCVLRTGSLASQLIAAVGVQILTGLAYLHEACMIHRDLKPENVLLQRSGAVKLCDFGVAALGEQSLNISMLGTTKFMAPERLRAQPYGRSSDVWSFGLILLECATGESPWSDVASIVELLVTIEEMDVNDLMPEHMEDGFREIVFGCLKLEPGRVVRIHITQ